jgi:hypothetical protein
MALIKDRSQQLSIGFDRPTEGEDPGITNLRGKDLGLSIILYHRPPSI